MATKAAIVTRDYLKYIPLPVYTGNTYTVIAHDVVIQLMEHELQSKGLDIIDSYYKSVRGGNVASGVYHIKYQEDPEIGLMIGWLNSYDKSKKFSCTVGGYNKLYENYYFPGDISVWNRKHTGSADQEAMDQIKHQISLIDQYYQNITNDRKLMQNYPVNSQLRGSVLGYLYFERRILSTDQASRIKQLMQDPTVPVPLNNMWDLYNYITMGIKDFNPNLWIQTQTKIRNVITNDFMVALMPKINNDDEVMANQLDMFNPVTSEITIPAEEAKTEEPAIFGLEHL